MEAPQYGASLKLLPTWTAMNPCSQDSDSARENQWENRLLIEVYSDGSLHAQYRGGFVKNCRLDLSFHSRLERLQDRRQPYPWFIERPASIARIIGVYKGRATNSFSKRRSNRRPLITMALRAGIRQASTGMEMVSPEPERVACAISKQLTGYILTCEEMEAYLKEEFSSYENYDFDVKVTLNFLICLPFAMVLMGFADEV